MRILMYTEPYLDAEHTRPQQIYTLLHVLKDAYNEEADDDEAYLSIDHVADDDIIFGSDDPQAILDVVKDWNDMVVDNLREALNGYVVSFNKNKGHDNPLAVLDNTATYELKKAAMAADNDFYSFADNALYIPVSGIGATYFHTVLSNADLALVRQEPENFAILEVPAK